MAGLIKAPRPRFASGMTVKSHMSNAPKRTTVAADLLRKRGIRKNLRLQDVRPQNPRLSLSSRPAQLRGFPVDDTSTSKIMGLMAFALHATCESRVRKSPYPVTHAGILGLPLECWPE